MRRTLFGSVLFLAALAGPDAMGAQFLWQTNAAGDDVHVYAVDDFRLVRRLKVGPNPHGIAAPDDARVIFLSLEADGRDHGELLWIDPRSFEILHRLDLGLEPHTLATTPDGKWVYVACRDGHYWVVDAIEKRVVKKIRTGGRPHNIQASRDGRFMYLSPMEGQKDVFIVDVSLGHEVVGSIAFPDSVRPSALSADGKILLQQIDGLNGFVAADTATRKILATVRHSVSIGWFSPIKNLGFVTFDGLKRCHGLGIHPNQREVWSVCAENLTIHRLEPSSFAEEAAIKLPRNGYWLTFSRDGRFGFVALNDGVAVIDAVQRKIVRVLPAGDSPKRNLVIEY